MSLLRSPICLRIISLSDLRQVSCLISSAFGILSAEGKMRRASIPAREKNWDGSPAKKENENKEKGSKMNPFTVFSNDRQWNPFQEMGALGHRWNHILFGDRGLNLESPGEAQAISLRDWSPLVDIMEGDGAYLMKAELPEVAKEDVSVRVENGVLSISGERKAEVVKSEKKIHRVERAYGRFVRSFRVPENADASKVKARFKDGVLQVVLPKLAEAKAAAVEINVD